MDVYGANACEAFGKVIMHVTNNEFDVLVDRYHIHLSSKNQRENLRFRDTQLELPLRMMAHYLR